MKTKPKKIITDEPKLSIPSREVSLESEMPLIKKVIDELTTTAIHNQENGKCVGMAANQIGHLVRIVVIRLKEGWFPMINLEIKVWSKEKVQMSEFCLSRPNKPGIKKRRSKWVIVEFTFLDEEGKPEFMRKKIEGFAARIIQHERDHLEGKLI